MGNPFNRAPSNGVFPPSLSPKWWWRGDLGITLDSSNNVSQWSDIVAGLALSQATAGNRPGLTLAPQLNNQPALVLDGATSYLQTGLNALSLAQPSTYYVVCRITNSTGANTVVIFDSRSGSTGTRTVLGVNLGNYYMGAITTSNSSQPNDFAAHAICAQYNGAASAMFQDAAVNNLITTNPGTNSQLDMIVGTVQGASTLFLAGNIAEIVIFPIQHSLQQTSLMMQYFNQRYGAHAP